MKRSILNLFCVLAIAVSFSSCKKDTVKPAATIQPAEKANYDRLTLDWISTEIPFSSLGLTETGRVNLQPNKVSFITIGADGTIYARMTNLSIVKFKNGVLTEIYKHPYPKVDGRVTRPVIDGDGNIYFGASQSMTSTGFELGYAHIYKITPDGETTLFAGGVIGTQNGGAGNARFGHISDICLSKNGVMYVADYTNGNVRKIAENGEVSTLVDRLQYPRPKSIAVDNQENVYIDYVKGDPHVIGKLTPGGVKTVVYSSDDLSNGDFGPLVADKFNNIILNVWPVNYGYPTQYPFTPKVKIIDASAKVWSVTINADCRAIAADPAGNFYTLNNTATTSSVVKYSPE